MAISKTQRWLDLIAFLVGHHFPVDVDQVMNAVPAYREKWNTGEETDKLAVRKMFERDKAELRDAGIPLETRDFLIDGVEKAKGYQLAGADFYLPYLRIVRRQAEESGEGVDPGEGDRRGAPTGAFGQPRPLELGLEDYQTAVDALHRVRDLPASPFAREARTALSKLTFDAPDLAAGAPVLYADDPETHEVRDRVRTLRSALEDRARVRFTYHGIHRDTETERDVAPYGLLFQRGHWYLIGADALRDHDIRVFRVSRIRADTLEAADAGAYAVPDDFDLSAYAHREAWELGDDDPVPARVRFDFPLALWAERNGKGEAVEEAADGAVIREFDVRQTDPFLRWLQGFAGEAVVVAPPELRAAQRDLARRTLAVYGVAPRDEEADGDD